jgi:hypothetical protein
VRSLNTRIGCKFKLFYPIHLEQSTKKYPFFIAVLQLIAIKKFYTLKKAGFLCNQKHESSQFKKMVKMAEKKF